MAAPKIRPARVAKRVATWQVCDGEAHSNGHIDSCGACSPWWGSFPTCISCVESVDERLVLTERAWTFVYDLTVGRWSDRFTVEQSPTDAEGVIKRVEIGLVTVDRGSGPESAADVLASLRKVG